MHLTILEKLTHLNLDNCNNFTNAGLTHFKSLVTAPHLNITWGRRSGMLDFNDFLDWHFSNR
ncbi:unnamed protein product [Candidatus Protochlamydia amoebophila UWE25]|uniref:Uncharacterized protein n=1 Tax=Protochlamydia amoebophila (strain UWE25) TaxID=264201 RepID=Q6MD69_PARUW|nr:unnamed protein product [Candidatus Protochlamydia amoebophila UWE25]